MRDTKWLAAEIDKILPLVNPMFREMFRESLEEYRKEANAGTLSPENRRYIKALLNDLRKLSPEDEDYAKILLKNLRKDPNNEKIQSNNKYEIPEYKYSKSHRFNLKFFISLLDAIFPFWSIILFFIVFMSFISGVIYIGSAVVGLFGGVSDEATRRSPDLSPQEMELLCDLKPICLDYAKARQNCATAGNYKMCMEIKLGNDRYWQTKENCTDTGELEL